MQRTEWKTVLTNLGVVARNPGWFLDYAFGGRKRLLSKIVLQSIAQVRATPPPGSLDEIARLRPVSTIGKLGAPQELLYHIVRFLSPARCVETGVYRGISTAFILAGLHDNRHGHLTSIDLPSARYLDSSTSLLHSSPLLQGEATGFVVPDSLRYRWSLRLGDSKNLLPRVLEESGPVDLFYHDSVHTYEFMTWEFETAKQHLAPMGVVASDDTNWNNAFRDFCSSSCVAWSTVIGGRIGVAQIGQESPRDVDVSTKKPEPVGHNSSVRSSSRQVE